MNAGQVLGIIWLLKTFMDIGIIIGNSKLRRKWKTTQEHALPILFVMGTIAMIFVMIPVFIAPEDWRVGLWGLIPIFLELLLWIVDFSENIYYDEKHFCRGLQLVKGEFQEYQELDFCKVGTKYCVIGVKHKLWEVRKDVHAKAFVAYAKERYRLACGEELSEEFVPDENDEFGGRLERPQAFVGEYKALVVMMTIVFLFVVGMLCGKFLRNERNTVLIETKITEWYYSQDKWNDLNMVVDSAEKEIRLAPFKERSVIEEEMTELIWDERTVSIYVDRVFSKSGTYYQVYDMKDEEGRVYVTFDEMNAYYRKTTFPWIIVMLLLESALISYYCYMMNIVKNPQKYSEKTRKKVEKIAERYRI